MKRLVPLLACALGCGHSDPTYPDPFLPTIDGWHAVESEVVVGQHTHFELRLVWPAPHDGLIWTTSADLYAAHAGGLPADPVHDITIVDKTDDGEIVEGPTADTGYLFAEAGGFIDVCQDREDGTCVRGYPTTAYALVGGGAAHAIDFPVDAVDLLVGEHRVMQPMPTALAEHGVGTTTSHEAMTYTSSDPGVVTVDANGLLAGVAPGSAILTVTAGAAHGDLPITVAAGAPALPSGGVLVTDRATPGSVTLFSYNQDGDTPDRIAIAPDGHPAFVLAPNNASTTELSGVIGLNLVQWTGSGLGFERISAWWEHVRAPFFALALDGHQFAGWVAERGTGLVVLDRPGDVEVGGWQRRRLPMRPDPTVGAEREDGPQWPFDFGPYNQQEGISTLLTPVISGTLSAPDGVWIAYGWGAHYYLDPNLPPDFPSSCVRIVRLAHVTPTAITTEDVNRVFLDPKDCDHLLHGLGEQQVRIQVGRPLDGTDRPTILVSTVLSPGAVLRVFQHGRYGWVTSHRWGTLDPGEQGAIGMPIVWSPGAGDATSPLLFTGGLDWAGLAMDGTAWLDGSQRRGPYGNAASDSILGPTFAAQGATIPTAEAIGFLGGAGGYGQIALLNYADPMPPANPFTHRTWLYQYAMLPSPHPEDSDLSGTRLSATADTPRYRAILPLSDGGRLMIGRPNDLSPPLAASRSTGPGLPFDAAAAITNGDVADPWTAWADGTRAWLAHGANPVTLTRSSDRLVSVTPIATIPALGGPTHGLSTSPGVSWLLTAPDASTKGPQLWRLDDTSGTLVVTELPVAMAGQVDNLADPTLSSLALGTSSVWVVAWLFDTASQQRVMVTRHYALDGALLSAKATPFAEFPLANAAAATGTGALVVPIYAASNDVHRFMTSTDAGASWTETLAIELLDGYRFPQPVLLGDGRLALVATFRNGDPEQVGILTTTDGMTWSAVTWVRPQGGHVQRVWATARDAAGDLLIHLGDAGTIAGRAADGDAYPPTGPGAWNGTQLEGLLVRVPM